ncbi:sporulation protein [Candidatus Nitromaritima sp. SCGC AAA799-C22]|nr:sporulation protein [Candidatus Nitromaritima sp. SCGC AAA799-C22]
MDQTITDNRTQPAEENKGPRFLVGVRVGDTLKSELFDPVRINVRVGVQVMVETDQGIRLGRVASNKIPNLGKKRGKVRRVLRIANQNDFQAQGRKQDLENRARNLCAQKIKELKLQMNLSRVVHLPQQKKTIFFFTAEGRVDFRQLIKELVSNLRHRIEMKQVGVRDEARAITGYGVCGQTLCCSSFLEEFNPVTIRMAKDQGLALNPSKISGVCGRLMCCLQYEHDTYKELIKGMPKSNSKILTPDGPGRVLKNDILEQNILVRLEDESIISYSLDELKDYLKPRHRDSSSPRPKNS